MPPSIRYRRCLFASRLPTGFLYTPDHFWLRKRPRGLWRVGLTKFGTKLLGEIVESGFRVASGVEVEVGQVIGFIEGFKAVSELRCVGRGRFGGGNPALMASTDVVHADCHGKGWLYEFRGTPAPDAVDVHDYCALLDQAIDRIRDARSGGEEG